MAHVTLILCRTPLQEFHRGRQSGRWGDMLMIEGPRVFSVTTGPAIQATVNTVATIIRPFMAFGVSLGAEPLTLGGQSFTMVTDGSAIAARTEFDSMERFRADSGSGFYMQTRPKPREPYRLTMFTSSTVAKLNDTGRCLRVHGHGYVQQGTHNEAGILIHEAPHVGWLIGCISPRPKNQRIPDNEDRAPSRQAMNSIFTAMGGFATGKEASLIVLDW